MMTTEALATRLETLVGAHRVWTDDRNLAAYTLASMRPGVVVQPSTGAQVANVLALAQHEHLVVVPWGRGTQMHLGQLPAQYDLALSLAGLNQVVEYDAANLTFTAGAGLPVREVYRLTLPQRQFLPLGFPGTNASLGGLLATNTSGNKRLRYGGVRDLLLGVQVALPDGSLVRFGGRVVKNVAGYDMNKLFIGSLGVFGVVVETTYRLVALPEADCLLALVFPDLPQALSAVAALRSAMVLPSALTLLSTEVAAAWCAPLSLTVQAPQVVLLINYDGTAEAVSRQMQESRTLGAAHSSTNEAVLGDEALLTLWEQQESWRTAPPPEASDLLQVRLGVPPAHLEEALTHLTLPVMFCPQGLHWLADVGNGQITARLPLASPGAETQRQEISDWLHALRTPLQALQGYVVVEWAPPARRAQLDVWGGLPGLLLLQRYKQQFDPQAILNPGRFVPGL